MTREMVGVGYRRSNLEALIIGGMVVGGFGLMFLADSPKWRLAGALMVAGAAGKVFYDDWQIRKWSAIKG